MIKKKAKADKEKTDLEKRIVDTYGEKGPDAPKTVDGLMKVLDNPKLKAKVRVIQRYAEQYIDQGMDNAEAFRKAEREVEDELKKRGISLEEAEKKLEAIRKNREA